MVGKLSVLRTLLVVIINDESCTCDKSKRRQAKIPSGEQVIYDDGDEFQRVDGNADDKKNDAKLFDVHIFSF